MSPTALVGARVFDGERLRDGHAVIFDGGTIRGVVPDRDVPAGATIRRVDGLLAPGFIDVQINGGGGIHEQLSDFLSGKKYFDVLPHGQYVGSEPFDKWVKPSIVLMGVVPNLFLRPMEPAVERMIGQVSQGRPAVRATGNLDQPGPLGSGSPGLFGPGEPSPGRSDLLGPGGSSGARR